MRLFLKPGFTLVELLVVISILGIISTASIIFYENAQAKTRDAKKKQDLATIKVALNLYYQENGVYPTIPGGCCEDVTGGNTLQTALVPKYLKALPQPPKYDFLNYYSRYSYDNVGYSPTNTGYRLYAWLENSKDPDAGLFEAGTYQYMTLPPN